MAAAMLPPGPALVNGGTANGEWDTGAALGKPVWTSSFDRTKLRR
jgi:hypothetical protein